jgi:hypothetical protein
MLEGGVLFSSLSMMVPLHSIRVALNLLSEGYFLILRSDKKSCGALDEGDCHVCVASDRRRIKEIALRAGVTKWKY